MMGILVISLITLVLLEVVLRTLGFYKTYTEKMDGEYRSFYGDTMATWFWARGAGDSILDNKPEYTYHSKTNNYGFADKDFDSATHCHTLKGLVLGDSFAQGMGAPPDSSWPALVQAQLNGKGDSIQYRIYNCGTAGSDPFFEYVVLKEKLIKLHPDLVIMSINYSDINDCITRGGLERFHSDGTTHFSPRPWFEPLYKHVHLIRMFVHFVLRYDFSLLSSSALRSRSYAALQSIAACADSSQKLCTAHGSRFIVVLHPYLDPYDRYLKKQDILPQLMPLLEARQIPVINLFDDFRQIVNKDNYQTYSWPRDMHYTSRGYYLFASLLVHQLRMHDPDLLVLEPQTVRPCVE